MSSDKPTNSETSASPDSRSAGGWLGRQLKENLSTIAVAVVLAAGVRWFIAEPRYIPSSSMEPTLQIDDRLIIEKMSYRFRKPARGEIVVFYPPASPVIPDNTKVYIKRVIGLPGDLISIHDGKVFINHKSLQEPYIAAAPAYTLPTSDPTQCLPCFQPSRITKDKGEFVFTVPAGQYWVMGDNRNNSLDSHAWGFLPEDNIVGRAWLRYWPLDNRVGQLTIPKYD